MKLLILISTLFLSIISNAFEDGTYTCGSRETQTVITYKIKTLTIDGVALPHLDVTKNYYKNPADPSSTDHRYQIEGIATLFTNESGQETLVIGNITVDLVAGRVSCNK